MKRQNVRKLITIITFLLFPITIYFLSPYIIIDGAINGVMTGSFIIFSILLITSLLLGRSFCSWVCPMAALQDMCFCVNNKKVQGKRINKVKYFIWVPWIAAILIIVIQAGGFKIINPLYFIESGISIDAPFKYITYYVVIGLFLVLSFIVGKRAACHSICWMAPFMIIGSKFGRLLRFPKFHLEVDCNKCSGCKTCETKCPMSLEVNSMVNKGSMLNNECILCCECVDTCSKNVIRYRFGKEKKL